LCEFVLDTSALLGKGEHGAVYTGIITSREDKIAVKTTFLSMSTLSVKQLLAEIKILIHVGKHQNVIDFIGAYTAEKENGKNVLNYDITILRITRTLHIIKT